MGNKQSTDPEQQQTEQTRTPSPALINSALTPEAIDKLERCLQKFPLEINDSQREGIIGTALVKQFTRPGPVLRKGEEVDGIFIVVSGRVQIVSENQRFVLREVTDGEYFGEVSTLFRTKCTVDVRADSRCELLLIKSSYIQELFPSLPDTSLFQWFVQRKYIDTSQLFERQSLAREQALKCLKESPMLQGWSVQAVTALVDTLNDGITVLYPAKSAIYREGESGHEVFLLVSGRISFSTGEQDLATFDAGEQGFCFGDEGLFMNSERRSTVRAVTPCQIITIRMENCYHMINKFGTEASLFQDVQNRWQQAVKARNVELYIKYGGAFDVEILRMALKRTAVFRDCPAGFLYLMALSMTVVELRAGGTVLKESECDSTLFIVLHGSVVVMDGQLETEHRIGAKRVFWKTDDMPERGWVQAMEQSVVAQFPASAIRDAQDSYPMAVVHKP